MYILFLYKVDTFLITWSFFLTFSFFSSSVNKDMDSGRLDDSLTNIQWLGRMSTCALQSDHAKQKINKENQSSNSQTSQVS